MLARQLSAQKAELVAFRISQYVPALIAALADVRDSGTCSQQSRKLRFLITVSWTDVKVQAQFASLGTRTGPEHDRGLQAAESSPRRPDLDTVLYEFKLGEPKHLTPEGRQPSWITAVDHYLAHPACHAATVRPDTTLGLAR